MTPGLVLAGIYVFVVFTITDRASQLWLWSTALILCCLVDYMLGWSARKVLNPRTKTVYVRDDDDGDGGVQRQNPVVR